MQNDQEANKDIANPRGGNWFKMQEGDNQMRIMVEPEVLYERYRVGICYTDCGYRGTPKYLTWILDRADKQFKLWKMPFTLFEQLAGLQMDEDFQFSEFPMPYDIKVSAKDAGSKEVKYQFIGKPAKELSQSEKEAWGDFSEAENFKMPVDLIGVMKDKQKKKVESGEVNVPDESEGVHEEEDIEA